MATLNIPLITLQIGTRSFGPANVPDADTHVQIILDRTVANGMNFLPGTSSLNVAVEESDDGGTTWYLRASSGAACGIITSKYTHLPETGLGVSVSLGLATGRKLRATTTTVGSAIAIAGTLTTE